MEVFFGPAEEKQRLRGVCRPAEEPKGKNVARERKKMEGLISDLGFIFKTKIHVLV